MLTVLSPSISFSIPPTVTNALQSPSLPFPHPRRDSAAYAYTYRRYTRRSLSLVSCPKSSSSELTSTSEDEWLNKLPDKKKALYSHSLPCIEAWLKDLGFYQSKEDRAVWLIEKPDWHAQLTLDITDIYIRYLKSGPGKLEKDGERRFSYALSREDIQNAILGGP